MHFEKHIFILLVTWKTTKMKLILVWIFCNDIALLMNVSVHYLLLILCKFDKWFIQTVSVWENISLYYNLQLTANWNFFIFIIMTGSYLPVLCVSVQLNYFTVENIWLDIEIFYWTKCTNLICYWMNVWIYHVSIKIVHLSEKIPVSIVQIE